MTNSELAIKFAELAASNPFDAAIELKKFKKQYKTSDFYKATHMSCVKAYEFYCKTMLGRLYYDIKNIFDTDSIAIKLTDIIDGIDQTTINTFFDRVLDSFNGINLQQEKGEAKLLINELKNALQ